MNHYLVLNQTYFVSPHRDLDDGGTKVSVFETPINIDTNLVYREDLKDFDIEEYVEILEDMDSEFILPDDYEYEGSEDGYNMEVNEIRYIKISKEEYDETKQIVDGYIALIHDVHDRLDLDWYGAPYEDDEDFEEPIEIDKL